MLLAYHQIRYVSLFRTEEVGSRTGKVQRLSLCDVYDGGGDVFEWISLFFSVPGMGDGTDDLL